MLLLLLRSIGVRTGRSSEMLLSLLQRGPECGVLDAQLVDERAAFFPPPIGLVCRGQRGVEQLRARFKGFYMSERVHMLLGNISSKRGGGNALIPSLAECALCFPVLFSTFARAQLATLTF